MSELDDRLKEGRETVATMGPPEDLWARVVERSNDGYAAVLDLTVAPQHRRRPSLWLAVVAVAACLLAVVAVAAAVTADRQAVDTVDPAESPTPTTDTTTTEAADDGPTTLAKGEDVEIGGFAGLAGQTLNIDAVEEDGEVTGEFRVNNVVVTLQCADISSDTRDLILGGEVTDNPNGLATLDEVNVAVGDLVALIIRQNEPDRERVTLFDPTILPPPGNDSAGSCSELVESVPGSLDGGFFDDVADGYDIETGPFSRTLAKGEDVEIGGFGGLAGQTLNIDAVEEDGEVTGEFRVNNVVVTLQCADTDTIDGEIRLGGEVTDDPDGQGLAVIDGEVAVGDRVVLIIRERGPDFDMVSLYANDGAGSCTELVESVPYNLDGGFFNDVEDGDAIETGGVDFNP